MSRRSSEMSVFIRLFPRCDARHTAWGRFYEGNIVATVWSRQRALSTRHKIDKRRGSIKLHTEESWEHHASNAVIHDRVNGASSKSRWLFDLEPTNIETRNQRYLEMMKQQILKLLRDERGLTTVEYAVAGALITVAVVAAFRHSVSGWPPSSPRSRPRSDRIEAACAQAQAAIDNPSSILTGPRTRPTPTTPPTCLDGARSGSRRSSTKARCRRSRTCRTCRTCTTCRS